MTLSTLDQAVVIGYLLFTMAIGVYLTRRVKSSSDYFLAGRQLPFWAIGASIVVTDIGATSMIGLSAEGYQYGLVAANWDWIGSFAAMVLSAFIFIPWYWRTKCYTIPEFLGRRYNQPTRTLHSTIWLLVMIFDIGIIFHAAAGLMGEFMGWSYWPSIAALGVIIGVYMVGAGLAAVVFTDVLQLIVMFAGGFTLLIVGLNAVGGWQGMVDKIEALGPDYASHLTLYHPPDSGTPYPWTGILFGLGFVMSTAYFVGNQSITQRCMGARSEWDAKASMLLGAGLKALIPIMVVTPGLIALAHFGVSLEGDNKDKVYPMLIKELLPTGMVGLMFAALIAALMSTIDSVLNAISTLFTKDLYQVHLRPDASDAELLKVGRLCTLVVLILGAATAPMSQLYEGIYEWIQTLMSIVAGPTLAVLVLGVFWSRCTQWGGFFGLLFGCCFTYLLSLDAIASQLFIIKDPFLYVSFWSFLFSCGVAWIVSQLSEPWPKDRIIELLWRPNASTEDAEDDPQTPDQSQQEVS